MNVLQGHYLNRIESKSGKLKGLTIKTDSGIQAICLPKKLRAIAQQELTVGDPLRVWTTQRKKDSPDQKGKPKKKRKSSASLWALQLIPLSPKTVLNQPADNAEQPSDKKVEMAKPRFPTAHKQAKKQAKKRALKAKKKKSAKKLTVQLCQKKNCCKRGGTQLWAAFESARDAAKNTPSMTPFKLEAAGCLGGCKHGPNLRFLPDNVKHYHVQPKDVETLLAKHR